MAENDEPTLEHWLLAGAQTHEIQPVLANAQQVRFLPGEVIFEAGDPADGLYLIAAGSVRVTAPNERGDVLLATISANDVLGEMGVLDGEPRSGTATALGLCTAYFVPGERFLDALEQSPWLCVRMLALMTERLRLANEPLKRFPSLAAADDPFAASSGLARSRETRPPAKDPMDLQIGEEPRGFYTPDTESFYDWLIARGPSSGQVGELARYAGDDPRWPRDAEQAEVLKAYLEARHAEPAIMQGLGEAWRAWQVATHRAELKPDFEGF